MARKPFKGTVANNVLEHGTGAINIDASRISYNGEKPNIGGRGAHGRGDGYGFKPMDEVKTTKRKAREEGTIFKSSGFKSENNDVATADPKGRWPANIIHDGSDEATNPFQFDSGSAARFFYCAKASKSERNAGLEGMEWNIHPTVKPVALMEYLVRLVTPADGLVLDPFLGSGTTGVAAIKNDFHFIGIEREAEYIPIAENRMSHVKDEIVVLEEVEDTWL